MAGVEVGFMPDESQQQRPPDVTEFWRQWLTESERQFNAFFNSSMNNDAFARTAGSYMEMYAGFQRLLAEGMQRYLTFVNMPSRTDVIGLGEMLRVIEARLARIEDSLLIGADVSGLDRGHVPFEEPARTRRPPDFPGGQPIAPPPAPEPEPLAYAPGPEPIVEAAEPSFAPPPIPEPAVPVLSEEAVAELLEASSRLQLLEERLARIEETLRIAMEFMEVTEAAVEEAPAAIENGAGVTAIPEELRR